MSLASIQTLEFTSYCSPVQSRMAGASTSVYEFDGVVICQRIYKSAWTPLTDTTRKCMMREDNIHDKHTLNDQL